MKISFLTVPYNMGVINAGPGLGPRRWLASGLVECASRPGHSARIETIEIDPIPTGELRATFALHRRLSQAVSRSLAAGELPFVLSGNCGAAVGTLAGMSGLDPAVIWIDAHGDFNTPETTASGLIEGMPLAIAAGQCWQTLASTIPGYRPVASRNILHLGARDLDPGEAALLNQQAVTVITSGEIQSGGAGPALSAALDRLGSRPVYLHIDLDVLDPTLAPTNEYYAPGGLTPDDLVELVTLLRARTRVSALCFASYDPAYDPHGKTIQAGLKLAGQFFSV